MLPTACAADVCCGRYAPECDSKGLPEVAPDGAEMAGLAHRAEVSDVGTGAVVSLKGCSYGGKRVGGGVVDTHAGEGSVG